MQEYLPDLSHIADNATKRKIENLSHKFELLLNQLSTEKLDDRQLREIQVEINKTWYKMNAQVGKLYEQHRNERSINIKYYLSLLISIIALIISTLSILKD